MSMEMDHSFTVPVPPDQAWDVLLDVERIAPCMPGATVDEFDGEVVTGRIKVKVGPVSLTYRGTAKFIERDPAAQVVVLDAAGKETRGAGTASATVRASLEPEDSGQATKVTMHTTMNVTGRPAQFGRGVMVEVGGKLVERFAGNLAHLIAGDDAAAADGAGGSGPAGVSDGSGPAGVSDGSGPAGVSDGSGPAGVSDVTAGSSAGADLTDAGSSAGAAVTDAGSAVQATAAADTATAAPVGSAESAATVPVARTTVPPPAPQQDDSINLVKLVGPAVVKRVVPVAIAAAALVLAGYGLGRRHRGGGSQEA